MPERRSERSVMVAGSVRSRLMPPPSQAEREADFLRLFNQGYEQLQAYIAVLLPQAADADDVFQQTSVTLWQKFSECPDKGFLDWARGVAFNTVRNYRRAEARRAAFMLRDEVLDALAKRQRANSGQLTVRREALRGCLKKLPKVDRELIDRCYRSVDKLKLKDVAAERKCTPTALYKRLHGIRVRLFDCIQHKLQREARSNG